jgi:hypothetical protein
MLNNIDRDAKPAPIGWAVLFWGLFLFVVLCPLVIGHSCALVLRGFNRVQRAMRPAGGFSKPTTRSS